MEAVSHSKYGTPNVLALVNIPTPTPGARDVLGLVEIQDSHLA